MQALHRNLPKNPNTHLLLRSLSSSPAISSPPSSSSRRLPPISEEAHQLELDSLVDRFKKCSNNYRFRRKHSVYDLTVRRLASAERFNSVQDILEHQKQFSDISKEGFSIRLISLYGKANMFDHARKLFDELPQLNCPRTVKSFNALLTAALESKDYDTVTKLFHELSDEISVEPNIFSYNILIQALCKMGSLSSTFSVLESMEKNGVKPNLITFDSLLNAFYNASQFSDAKKVWDEMEKSVCVPDVMIYNAKLRGLVSEGNTEEAVKLVDKLRDQGLEPDVFSFNALMKGYCDNGNLEEAKKIYDELGKNDCTPNRWTFETLIPCAVKKGDLAFAVKLCKVSINGKWSIDVSFLQGVVHALVKESSKAEAQNLVKLAASKNYRYSSLKMP
ncbi:hypothetical protein AAC387_Pa07g0539 [Persea americana]